MKLVALCLALCISAVAGAPQPDTLLGRYWLPEKDGQLEIYRQGDRYSGRIVAYDVAGQVDVKNPDPKMQSRSIVGMDLLSGFHFDKKSRRWDGGTIYDAKSGKTYKCRLLFDDNDLSVLWARGYVGLSILGRTERFIRIVE